MRAKELLEYYNKREAEIQLETNKKWGLAVMLILWVIIIVIFIGTTMEHYQAIAHLKALTSYIEPVNHAPVFIR